MSLTFYDHGARTNWTQSIMRTGIPPANPLYFFKHAADLRYYYFWLVDCAVVAKISHLPARTVLIASCVWAAFALATLVGLYLKHFLMVGERLREQLVLTVSLFAVSGLFLCVNLWNILYLQIPLPADVWSRGQVTDWFNFFLFYPHHLVSMICCMFAFLLAWMSAESKQRLPVATVIVMAAAMASAFGLSVYVAFAFALVMLVWMLWQVIFERRYRAPLVLVAAGVVAGILLIPYLWELTHTQSKIQGGSVFAFSVRETIPPEALLASPLFHPLAVVHPYVARSLANLLLMPFGYAIELGFLFVVFLIYLVPAWRGHRPLTPAQRTLLVITVAIIPFTSLIRSGVLVINDFGIHSALFMQFPLLLLASELLINWRYQERHSRLAPGQAGPIPHTPYILRSIVSLAIVIGVLSTCYRAFTLRLILPLSDMNASSSHDPEVRGLSHKAYISYLGYAKLDRAVPQDAIVQFNPTDSWIFWKNVDLANINHQVAIAGSELWCGSELGGDPNGCPPMAAAINPLYKSAPADQARATCHQFGIQYLVANMYDTAWEDKKSWVWTLKPVVSDPEFRAMDCR